MKNGNILRRLVFLFLTLAFAALLMTGCGGDNDGDTGSGGGSSEGGTGSGSGAGGGSDEEKYSKGLEYDTYEYESGEKYATVIGRGSCTDTDIRIPPVVDGYTVSGIGGDAFKDCTDIKSVSIPDTVTIVYSSPFEGCTGLESYRFDDIRLLLECGGYITPGMNGLEQPIDLYLDGELVKDLVIPEGTEIIEKAAFFGFTSIESVTFPEGLKFIDSGAFNDCVNIKRVYADSARAWCAITFDSEYSNPLSNGADLYFDGELVEKLRLFGEFAPRISDYAFTNCQSIESVYISGVDSIGRYAFRDCSRLLSVYMGGAGPIDNVIFDGCDHLAEVINRGGYDEWIFGEYALEIHNDDSSRITYVDDYAFYTLEHQTYLVGYVGDSTELVFPEWHSLYVIRDDAFSGRDDITSVTIPTCVSSIGAYSFYSCPNLTKAEIGSETVGRCAFEYCTALKDVVFAPGKSYVLCESAFSMCENVESVDIGDIKSWCNSEFTYFDSNPLYYADRMLENGVVITDLVIPESVYGIGAYVFEGPSLRTVTGSSTLGYISGHAFYYCDYIYSVDLPAVKSISDNGFTFCRGIVSVTLGADLEYISPNAFGDSLKICEVVNNSSLPMDVSDSSGVARGALEVHDGESRLEIKDGFLYYTTQYGDRYLVGYGGSSKHITIPEDSGENEYTMFRCAFKSCSGLESITVPAGVTHFAEQAFNESFENLYIEDISAWCAITFAECNDPYYDCRSCANPMCCAEHVFVDGVETSEIVIPADVKTVSPYAFAGYAIKSAVINNSDIGEFAFYECAGLERLVIGDNVEKIGIFAFAETSALKDVSFGTGLGEIDSYAFYNSGVSVLLLPEGLTLIGDYAFAGTAHAKVVIPSTVEKIGIEAFYCFKSEEGYMLKDLYISDLASWVKIQFDDNPISYCDNAYIDGKLVTELVIPEEITTIGAFAFRGWGSVTSVTLHDGITYIGSGAFEYAPSLKRVNVESIESWMDTEFATYESNPLSNGADLYVGGELFTRLVIPSDMIVLEADAFVGCRSIKDLVVHPNVEKIDLGATYHNTKTAIENLYISDLAAWCVTDSTGLPRSTEVFNIYLNGELLVDLVIPENVYYISAKAFMNCTSIKTVYFNEDVRHISAEAFYRCTNLESARFEKIENWWIATNAHNQFQNRNWKDAFYYVHLNDHKKIAEVLREKYGWCWKNDLVP